MKLLGGHNINMLKYTTQATYTPASEKNQAMLKTIHVTHGGELVLQSVSHIVDPVLSPMQSRFQPEVTSG